MIDTLLTAVVADPGDHLVWLALADALEEEGEGERAELARLTLALRARPGWDGQTRVQELLLADVQPCVPSLTNSIGMKLVLIPAGKFRMGTAGGSGDERPQHEVEISQAFWLGVYPVTQEEYGAVMGTNPSDFKGGRLPVEQVSWNDAVEFCEKLSEREAEKEAGRVYRLPTEAEWEYACRAGTSTEYNTGNDESALSEAGWYAGNSGSKTHEVGQKKGNAWGLYDTHGNVWEWCSDWYDANYYANSPKRDPSGPANGSGRVCRGGGWYSFAWFCRSAYRFGSDPGCRSNCLGFRVAASMEVARTVWEHGHCYAACSTCAGD